MTLEAYGTTTGRGSVLALGGCTLAVLLGYLVFHLPLRLIDFLHTSVAISFSLCLLALGVWVWEAGLSPRRALRLSGWCLLGGLATLAVSSWLLVLVSLRRPLLLDPTFLLLNGTTFGLALGGVVGLYDDRLRQRRRQLVEQSHRLDEFAHIVSHDLRNPLNIAQGQLEMARLHDENRHFDAAEHALHRMERLLREVLALAQQRVRTTDRRDVNIGVVAEDAWNSVAPDAATIHVDVDRTVTADPTRLQTLFENLFSNAVVHGGGDVTVRVVGIRDGIAVIDDGPGIPSEDQERVFEGGYSTCPDRSGFGLAIIRCIADAHGWDHQFVDVDAGTRFEIIDAR